MGSLKSFSSLKKNFVPTKHSSMQPQKQKKEKRKTNKYKKKPSEKVSEFGRLRIIILINLLMSFYVTMKQHVGHDILKKKSVYHEWN